MSDLLAIVMAGGKGERLFPLTRDRSKPAVPFGGIYRLIDITLSNCINSGIYKIMVLPQYKSQSLTDHLEAGWNLFAYDLGHYLRIVSPQMRSGEHWYQGTADSVRQNAYLIARDQMARLVLVLSGDHVYKMDYRLFRRYHQQTGAQVTISVIEVDRTAARSYGVVEVNRDFRVKAFHEKPDQKTAQSYLDSGHHLWNSGMFAWRAEVLLAEIRHHLPELAAGLEELSPHLGGPHQDEALERIYPKLPAISVDHGILEKSRTLRMVRADFGWSDVGSWEAMAELWPADDRGNACRDGRVLAIEARDNLVSAEGRLAALLGVEGLVVVVTDDVVMVLPRRRSQQVREIIARLQAEGLERYL